MQPTTQSLCISLAYTMELIGQKETYTAVRKEVGWHAAHIDVCRDRTR